ncbi:MAG: 2-dehydro-3-deoxygalactonokinase [Pseudomonadota bacterium]
MPPPRCRRRQISGFLAAVPDFAGTICLPGTHTKWASVADGIVSQFQTAMTGEIFALLAEKSVLRHSIGQGWDEAAFGDGVRAGHAKPGALAGNLFSLRAGSLLQGLTADAARAQLSGLLIGAELSAAPIGDGEVVVIGGADLGANYAEAIRTVGHSARVVDGAGITLAGLRQAWDVLKETFA